MARWECADELAKKLVALINERDWDECTLEVQSDGRVRLFGMRGPITKWHAYADTHPESTEFKPSKALEKA